MKSIYILALAVILVSGITALSLGGMNNITGAVTQNIDRFSLGSFSVVPLELNVYKMQSSNPDNECNLTIYSGTDDLVQETGKRAVAAYSSNPGWKANIPGATWIWNTTYVTDPRHDQAFTFVRTFNWTGRIDSASLLIASDNSYEVRLNNIPIGSSSSANNYASAKSYNVKIPLRQGSNTLKITVKNFAGNSNPTVNTAGLLYRLEIKKEDCVSCQRIACRTIYNFTDLKPGDKGSDIFKFDVTGGNAWGCLFIDKKNDLENQLIDPEKKSGDTTPGAKKGELSGFMQVFGWIDTDRDNKYSSGDTFLFKGNLSSAKPTFSIADTVGAYRSPIETGKPKYIGLFWCFGKITGISTYNLQCDGSSPENNIAQTDIMKVDFTFYAIQMSNNAAFRCNQSIIM
jgi:hypothetical protein